MKTMSPKRYQLLVFEKIHPHRAGIKKKNFFFHEKSFHNNLQF